MKICEIFKSIQGEGQQAGEPTVFIRTSGCNLKCSWCDTPYHKEGKEMTVEEIVKQVKVYGVPNVCITGGEPLLQEEIKELIEELMMWFNVYVETNGTQHTWNTNKKVHWILDYKLPSSGMHGQFLYSNLYSDNLYEIKLVIKDKEDYKWAKEFMNMYYGVFSNPKKILISPCFDKKWNTELAEQILKDNLPVRYSLQIHKILWKERGIKWN